ncbi:hypothetical protein ACVWXO_001245 [Bradyrhizobium sp. LM2.7]
MGHAVENQDNQVPVENQSKSSRITSKSFSRSKSPPMGMEKQFSKSVQVGTNQPAEPESLLVLLVLLLVLLVGIPILEPYPQIW